MKKLILFMTIFICLQSSHSRADVSLFAENFETDLSQWTGKSYGVHNGVIVDDPIRQGNRVLSFSMLENGGDIFHASGEELVVGEIYELSVEYLGLEIPGVSVSDNYGGFFGMSDIVGDSMRGDHWLFGTLESYNGLRGHLIDNGQWHTYTYVFEWERSEIDAYDDVVHIMMEDWISSNGSYGDVYFDNISLSIIPEPATLSLLFLGGLTLRRRKNKS